VLDGKPVISLETRLYKRFVVDLELS